MCQKSKGFCRSWIALLSIDLSKKGRLGIDVDTARKFVNLSKLEANSLPLQALAVA